MDEKGGIDEVGRSESEDVRQLSFKLMLRKLVEKFSLDGSVERYRRW